MVSNPTTTPAAVNRVFISCVSDEFEKPDAPFPGLRGQLRHYLTRADCDAKVQGKRPRKQATAGTGERPA